MSQDNLDLQTAYANGSLQLGLSCSQFFSHAWGKVLCIRVPNSFFYMMTWWLTSRMLEVIKYEQGPEMAAPHFWSSNLFMIYLEHGWLLFFRVLKKIQKQRISKQKMGHFRNPRLEFEIAEVSKITWWFLWHSIRDIDISVSSIEVLTRASHNRCISGIKV